MSTTSTPLKPEDWPVGGTVKESTGCCLLLLKHLGDGNWMVRYDEQHGDIDTALCPSKCGYTLQTFADLNREPQKGDLFFFPDGMTKKVFTATVPDVKNSHGWGSWYPIDRAIHAAAEGDSREPAEKSLPCSDCGKEGDSAIHGSYVLCTDCWKERAKPTPTLCDDGRDAGEPCKRAEAISTEIIFLVGETITGLDLIGTGKDECLDRVRIHIADITRLIRDGGHSDCGECPNCMSRLEEVEAWDLHGKWIDKHAPIVLHGRTQPPEELR